MVLREAWLKKIVMQNNSEYEMVTENFGAKLRHFIRFVLQVRENNWASVRV